MKGSLWKTTEFRVNYKIPDGWLEIRATIEDVRSSQLRYKGVPFIGDNSRLPPQIQSNISFPSQYRLSSFSINPNKSILEIQKTSA